jgi:gluconolactonase
MLKIFDPRFDSVAKGAGKLTRLCTGAAWSEGPVWMHEDDSVLWSDIPNNRMLRWQPQDGMSVWRTNAEFTNGHTRETDGALLHCSHGLRAIVRTKFEADLSNPKDEIVVDNYHGKRFNSPNDVVVKSDGTIWFTDPPYGIVSDREGHKADGELGQCYVFCFDPKTKALRIVTDWVEEPNGLAFSPDETKLYVSDTSAALKTDGSGNHHIAVFDVADDKNLSNPRVFAVIDDGLSDGFRLDKYGFLYTSSEHGVLVYHPDGTKLAHIPVPEKVGNLTFGGANRDHLFICASQSLYSIQLNTQGVACH